MHTALLSVLALAQTIVPQHYLVVEATGQGGRTPIQIDAVEALLARGVWTPPHAGDVLTLPDGETRTFELLESDEAGVPERRLPRGGWASATVELERAQVLLLEARGHRKVVVNGTPRVGDYYALGSVRIPIALKEGLNELLFRSGRGGFRGAKLVAPPADVFFEELDRTLPDVLVGEKGPLLAGVPVTNSTREWQRGLAVLAHTPGADPVRTELPPLAPVMSRKLGLGLPVPRAAAGESGEVTLQVLNASGTVLHADSIVLSAHTPDEKHRRTFVSEIDGSVQYYAVTPPSKGSASEDGHALFLSLHGASVEATNQAYSYQPKDWGVVVAPTNRRPFGFDWEDWGRLDALEVLRIAERRFGTDPRRTYLIGHSMGGHGTWNLGSQFPDLFAAIAPSAGWPDFWSYGGGATFEEPSEIEQMLMRSVNASRTGLLEENFRHYGVYVLHGDADDNVPVSLAREMRARLATFHPNFAYYERPGAGHWWGNACVDWPPLFEFLRHNVRPRTRDMREFAFVTVNPAISARCHFVTLEQQQHSLEPSRVAVSLDVAEARLHLEPTNVARLQVDLRALTELDTDGNAPLAADARITLSVEGAEASGEPTFLAQEVVTIEVDRVGATWSRAGPLSGRAKSPRRAGPFKNAFQRRFLFVYGTGGTQEERDGAYDKARYDAEMFWYRGNGSVEIVADRDFTSNPERNVILYGNADTNSAWDALLEDAPIRVTNGAVQVGERRLEGDDLAVLFVYPHPRSTTSSVGVVAGSGPTGMRATNSMPYFVSGVGYPDWTVFGPELLEVGSAGIRGSGFFDNDWALANGDAAWAE